MMIDFKEVSKLIIYKNSEIAGYLQRTEQGCQFILDPSFSNNTKAPYFSYCIPKKTTSIITHGDNLPPFFAGLLPVRWHDHFNTTI